MSLLLGYALIFFARVVDVTLATIRTLMVVQGRKVQAAMIGFFEVGIYITVLGKVVSGLDNPFNLLAYCAGYAAGNYVGITIENKIALFLHDQGEEKELYETQGWTTFYLDEISNEFLVDFLKNR